MEHNRDHTACNRLNSKERECGQGQNRTADTRRQPQAQGVIPSVMAFCKPAQLLPVLPKAKPKPAPTNIQFWHKAGTFFFRSINKGRLPTGRRGCMRRVYTRSRIFRIQKQKGKFVSLGVMMRTTT